MLELEALNTLLDDIIRAGHHTVILHLPCNSVTKPGWAGGALNINFLRQATVRLEVHARRGLQPLCRWTALAVC